MTKNNRTPVPPEVPADALPVDNAKAVLKGYYAGSQIPSPQGGFLMPLGVRTGDGGKGHLILECSASSLRYHVEIPKGTRVERSKVREVLDQGVEPDCPRHGRGQRLIRMGNDLVCQLCGVAFARV
ncbi:MAG: hypothetical protein OEZ65_06985 [Gemmatimonadota bacterium]|nr:hypothetical protein [Gemmatimonadota bacterium]MDH5759317.1 hypothetical protein [Gemmatimonadota bacterium]